MLTNTVTRCSTPASLQILGDRTGLPPLPSMTVALLRSAASRDHAPTDALEQEMLRILRREIKGKASIASGINLSKLSKLWTRLSSDLNAATYRQLIMLA